MVKTDVKDINTILETLPEEQKERIFYFVQGVATANGVKRNERDNDSKRSS